MEVTISETDERFIRTFYPHLFSTAKAAEASEAYHVSQACRMDLTRYFEETIGIDDGN